MSNRTRWGILGTGRIAGKFAEGLEAVPGAELVAVGSRTQESADAFADERNIPRRHACYEDLAADSDVDAIYVATPHALHHDNALLCIEAGKAVLCEKPFAINEAQAREMVEAARSKGVFLMEAMWTRFLPNVVRLRKLLAEGRIGDVHMLAGDFGFRAAVDPNGRLFDPALGGGALLDVGVYLVSLASMALGEPETVEATAHLGETGVDERTSFALGWGSGQVASFLTSIRTNTPMEATWFGSEGRIRQHRAFWMGGPMTLSAGDATEEFPRPESEGNGYNFQAVEVQQRLAAGDIESPVMPLDESIAVMRTLDRIRAKIGLRYPME